jgi:hypothetical protein
MTPTMDDKIELFQLEAEAFVNTLIEGFDEHLDLILSVTQP